MSDNRVNARPELLAPAGNFDCLTAAVSMGADAVYLSGKDFGARKYADNFDRDEILRAVRYCHLRGVKVHVTVNILVGDKELKTLREYLEFLDDAGVDALIIQDLGVLSAAKELGVKAQLHASTQLTVHNLAGAENAARLGFDRVVLSRELSFGEIKYISENCGIETEIFVHGAMCMSYSGQCLMSSMLGGRSGNRGSCAQPCRQPYICGGNREKFCLSLKDMSLIGRLRKVSESKAASLKIEGRMKGSAYVGCVTRIYADCLRDGRFPTNAEIDELNKIFFRGGQSSGYFDGKTGADMFTLNKPDNPYRGGSEAVAREVLSEIERQKDSFKIYLNVRTDISVGQKIRMRAEGGGISAEACGGSIIEEAKSRPTDRDTVIRQIRKTGGSVFEFADTDVNMSGAPYVPLSEINDVRRRLLSDAEDKILKAAQPLGRVRGVLKARKSDFVPNGGMTAHAETFEQYGALLEFERDNNKHFKYISLPLHILIQNSDRIGESERIIAELPAVNKDNEYNKLREGLLRLKQIGIDKLRVHNISGFSEYERGFSLFGSWRLNITNSDALNVCADCGLSAVQPSLELSLPQMRDIIKNTSVPIEVMAYGYVPLMLTENCIARNIDGKNCPCGGGVKYLTDRLKKRFPILKDGESCRSVLLNSVPLYMADKLDDIKSIGADMINLRFSVESPDEVKKICAAYFGAESYRINEYTRLHYYRGII